MDGSIAMKNKLNIRSIAELHRVEERESKKAILEMWENNELSNFKSGSVQLLRYIHFNSFINIYEWAGKIRDVQISKDGFQFSNIQFISENLLKVEQMPNSNLEEIIDKYAEMNIIHPFREGNGRTTRLWLDDMLKRNISMVVEWNNIGEREYLNAMIESHIDTKKLLNLIGSNLTDKLYDREVFFKGLDSSYYYEGMDEFITEEIANDSQRELELKKEFVVKNNKKIDFEL